MSSAPTQDTTVETPSEAAPEKPKVKPSFLLDFCSHKTAKHAVMRWHYSRRMPSSKLVRMGVWEDGRFVGAIIYGVGATPRIAQPFGLKSTQVCELVRVALAPGRYWPTSRCVAKSLKLLSKQSPGLKIVVSYADRAQGHKGTIYQACNFTFLGETFQRYLRVRGRMVHPRTLYDRYGRGGQRLAWLHANVDPHAKWVKLPAKLKYAYEFDRRLPILGPMAVDLPK